MSPQADPEPATFFDPRPLRDGASPEALALVRLATEGRLAFYFGAGLSMSPPTGLPNGTEVQRRVGSRAKQLLGVTVDSPAGDEPTLEELGDAAALRGENVLGQLRELAAEAVDFVHAPPNFGHHAVALLLREGLIEVLSVNWDRGVERAGMDLGYEVRPTLTEDDRSDAGRGARMDKLNGCASKPQTLRITREEVDKPLAWALHRVSAVLTDATVVFVGVGTVGDYVATGVERVLAGSRNAPVTLVVVSPTLSEEWGNALGDRASKAHVAEKAEPFLDELLRAVVLVALADVQATAEEVAEGGHPASDALRAGAKRLATAWEDHSAVAVWRWWRDGAGGESMGRPFILAGDGEAALTAVCALVGDRDPRVSGNDDGLVVELDNHYLEVCCWPRQEAATVVQRQADRIRRRRRRGVYRDGAKRVVTVSVGHRGVLPRSDASLDLLNPEGSSADIFDGSERLVVQWVAAEALLQGHVVELV